MDNRKNNTQKIIISLLAVLVLILLGALFVNSKNKDNNNDNDSKTVVTPTQTTTTTSTVTVSPTSTVSPTPTTTPETSPTPSTTVTPSPTSTLKSNEVKVHYSIEPNSSENPAYTFWFIMTTTRADKEVFALEQAIAGPTADQLREEEGLYTPIVLSGESNCGGKDFTLNIAQNTKVATVQFCRSVTSNGVGDDARIMSVVTETLKESDSIDEVVILNKDGDCFGDMSGLNVCKE